MFIGREHTPHWHRKAATLVSELDDPSAGETVKHKAAEALCELLGGRRRIFGTWTADRAYARKCAHGQSVAQDKLNARRIKQTQGEEDLLREASRLRGINDA